MNKKGKIITDWLDQYGDPEVEKFIAKNLAITEQVNLALEDKGWSKADLAEAMGKKPSEISKWLSGMHNLTIKSIIKMEIALGIDLIHTEKVTEYAYVFLGKIESKSDLTEKANDYEDATEMQEFPIAI